MDGEYSLIKQWNEIKCSQEYKNIDPKDICLISKNAVFLWNENIDK